MPKRNRVTPMGDIVASRLRGAWTGNRGILHDGDELVRFHRGKLWIICALQYKDSRLAQWAPGHFTVLFFHDEAVALAAGHRPCALCRRDAYNRYLGAWAGGRGEDMPPATHIDQQLHNERIVRGTHRRLLHTAGWRDVPSGAFVLADGQPALALDDAIVLWTIDGYGKARRRPTAGTVHVVTPPSTVAALAAGYEPQIAAAAVAAAAAAAVP